jgi:hypothetical protein
MAEFKYHVDTPYSQAASRVWAQVQAFEEHVQVFQSDKDAVHAAVESCFRCARADVRARRSMTGGGSYRSAQPDTDGSTVTEIVFSWSGASKHVSIVVRRVRARAVKSPRLHVVEFGLAYR